MCITISFAQSPFLASSLYISTMKHTDKPIIVEQSFPVSKDRLWAAITEHSQMTKWFFENIEVFKPEIGFQTKFVVENEGRVFPHLWTISKVVPYSLIAYNWKYEGYPGDSEVTFELLAQKNGTMLRVTHRVLESFPQDIPEFKRESCQGGWDYFIRQRLVSYLDNG